MRIIKTLFLIISAFTAGAQHVSQEMLKPLDFLVGKWKIEAHRRLAKNGPWDISTATASFQKIIGEAIFEENQTGTKEGRAFVVRTWLGNDSRTKLYQRVSVDSDHGSLSIFEGSLKQDTLALVTKLEFPDYTVHLRHRYIIRSADKFTFESARSTDAGETWDLTSRLEYSRVN